MSGEVLSALIAAGASVLGNLLLTNGGRKKEAVQRAKNEQRLEDRLDAIEKKLDVHNGYAEKLSELTLRFAELSAATRRLMGKE